jgi:pyruvate,orthophosphate dikinase
MMIAIEWERRTKPDLKIGICGEHGGHPGSVQFSHSIGLSYVSFLCRGFPLRALQPLMPN